LLGVLGFTTESLALQGGEEVRPPARLSLSTIIRLELYLFSW